jgi:hypothetical protein
MEAGKVTELSLSNGNGKYQSFSEDEVAQLLEQLAFLMRMRVANLSTGQVEIPEVYAQ